MDNSNNQSSQSRFLIAAVLSMVVLLGWSYFYTPKRPATDDANVNTATNTNVAATPVQQQPVAAATPIQQPVASNPDSTPNRTITIKSPLYEVKLDSRG